MSTQTIWQTKKLVLLSEKEFTKAEETFRNMSQCVVKIYSMFAIAIHIVLCVEVFNYENTASKVCSIVASSFFMVQHCYYTNEGCLFNLCCSLPVFIAGFAISNVELVNTLAFVIQLFILIGELYIQFIKNQSEEILKQRPKTQQGTDDQNSGKLELKIDGLQLSDKQEQEIKKEIEELAGLLQNSLQQIIKQKQLPQQTLVEENLIQQS